MYTQLLALFVAASAAVAAPTKRATENQATYYDVGLGACEWTNTDAELVVAMNQAQWNKADCGKFVQITNKENGNTAVAQIVDLCPSCATGSLDMSPTLFGQLANGDMDKGVFQISYEFTDGSSTTTAESTTETAASDSDNTDSSDNSDDSSNDDGHWHGHHGHHHWN